VPMDGQSDPKAHLHPGFEFLYVLEGELHIRHGENRCALTAGDAVYFDSSTPHSYICEGMKPASALIVTMHQPLPQMSAQTRHAFPPGVPRAASMGSAAQDPADRRIPSDARSGTSTL
jgi:uncharacterized RmlC-like cupin family protein